MTENEISYIIRGVIYDVYNELGPGLLESIYEEALIYELKNKGLKVERQSIVPVIYKGIELKTPMRIDILVEDKVLIEVKSVKELEPVFFKQTLTYLRLRNLKLGLLVNFNTANLDNNIKRVVNGI